MNNSPNRDYRFDYLKGILIFLVVLGHTIEQLQGRSYMVAGSVYSVIYSFHMPAFIFISGFFSKKLNTMGNYSTKQVKSLLIPFIFAHLLMWIFTKRSISSLFYPGWTLWYLLSLYFWKMIVVSVSKLRFSIIVSVIISLFVGFSPADRLLSISRTVAFFPLFLIGYKTSIHQINSIRKSGKIIPAILMILLFSIVIILKNRGLPIQEAFVMAKPYYNNENVTKFGCMAFRLIALTIGTISTFCLLALVPNKESVLSKLGINTMTVYLGHSFFLKCIGKAYSFFFPGLLQNDFVLLFFSFILSIFICYLFGNQLVASMYKKALDWLSKRIISQKHDLPIQTNTF